MKKEIDYSRKVGAAEVQGIYKGDVKVYHPTHLKKYSPHGSGVCKYKDGQIYRGEWKIGNRDGKGKLTWSNGDIYNGQWKNDSPDGKGKFFFMTGFQGVDKSDTYIGEVKNWLRHGKGTYTWVSQRMKYSGDWKNNNRHGYGVYKEGDSIYTGQWKDDKRWGEGKITIKDKYSISGIFMHTNIKGKVSMFFDTASDLKSYHGHIHSKTFQPHGTGELIKNSGTIYKGSFLDGELNGKILIKNAPYFSTETIDGKYVGSDSGLLTGLFKKGKLNGIFKWKMKSGRIYTGRINKKFKFHGRGILKHPGRDGLIQKGIWGNGKLIKREKTKQSIYLDFMSGITPKNLLIDQKYYTAYIDKLEKINSNKNIIYSKKALSYQKDRIKLALKRLLMNAAINEDDEWSQKNRLPLETTFLYFANFQSQKTNILKESSRKIINLYNKETKAFKDYIEFCREKHFLYPQKMLDKMRKDKNKKL